LNVAGAQFSVVGAGRSGVAAANVLAERGGDVVLLEAKADTVRPVDLHDGVAFRPGTNAVRPGDIAVLSPGITEVSPLRAEIAAVASESIGEVELFYRLNPAPVLAITGTDGKSTVTTMLGAIVEASGKHTYTGGNLGNPLCEGLNDLKADSVVVAEVSGFQLTTCDTFRPRVAVVTNIAEDHINYHGSYAAYQAGKRRIWQAMTDQDVLILNADDPQIAAWTWPTAPLIRTFSLDDTKVDAWYADRVLWLRTEAGDVVELMKRDELDLLGSHNVANALAAGLAALSAKIAPAVSRLALMAYKPLEHRLATIGTFDDVRWVNDSKATNPNAASAGIRAIETPLVLLAGGSEKGTDFTDFAALVRDRTKVAVLFGQTRHTLARAIGPDHPVVVVETLDAAVEAAENLADPGDTVLLGPACASFDQFKSYGQRGDVFIALVRSRFA
jgi:UDP-N-acetylmuramoylalanine--D-glutamate ligase